MTNLICSKSITSYTKIYYQKKVISENCNERRHSHTKLCKSHTQFLWNRVKALWYKTMICLKPLLSLLRYGQFPPTNLQTGDNKEPENVHHRHTDYIQLYIHNRFITKSNILNQQNKFAQLDLNVSILFCGMIFSSSKDSTAPILDQHIVSRQKTFSLLSFKLISHSFH